MDDDELYALLEVFVARIPQGVSWRLEGSANLRVQGVVVAVNDLDVVTNDLDAFRSSFKAFVVDDAYKPAIQARVLTLKLRGQEVEVLLYDPEEDLDYLARVEALSYRGLELSVLPLVYAQEFYTRIGRDKKALLIADCRSSY